VTTADLLLLADAYEAGDCPEAVLLDAIADLTKVHYQWRVHPIIQQWQDLVPCDTDPHWPVGLDGEPETIHPESVATLDHGIYRLKKWRLIEKWWDTADKPRRAATAAFARLLAGKE
jgi:hypothetical protein